MTRPELLLHPNIPKPLHGMSPREIKGVEWWDKTREAVYKQAGYKCQCCGVHKKDAKFHKWLEAHEIYQYDYANGVATMVEIVALCHSCHAYIHSGLLEVNLKNKKITEDKYWSIIDHGNALIREAGLTKPKPPTKVADWSSWRIIIDGEVFPTKWKSFEHWKAHYGR